MENLLPQWLQPQDFITMMTAIAAFLSILAVWNAAIVRDPMKGRIKLLNERRQALRAGFVAPKKRRSMTPRANSLSLMRQVVNKMNLLRGETTRKYTDKLVRAGYRSKDAIIIYYFFKLVLPILIGLAAIILIYGFNAWDFTPMKKLMVSLGSILSAFALPDIIVKNQITKREDKIRKALPDCLDLLVICAEAGLTVDASLMRVAREMGKSFPELADELSLTSIELGFLADRKQAIDNLARRVQLPAMKGVATTLIQSERYGTPLATSLRVLANEFRTERLMKAEEKAARLPATLTVPLIVFILPCLFVVLIGPAALRITDQFLNR